MYVRITDGLTQDIVLTCLSQLRRWFAENHIFRRGCITCMCERTHTHTPYLSLSFYRTLVDAFTPPSVWCTCILLIILSYSFIFFHVFSFSFHFLFIFFLFSFHFLFIFFSCSFHFFPESVWAKASSKSGGLLYIFTCSHLHHIFIPLHHHWSRGGAVAVTVAATVGVAVAVVPVALLLLFLLLLLLFLLLFLLLLLQRPPPFLLLNALSALWAIWARSKHRANGILEKLCVQCAVAAAKTTMYPNNRDVLTESAGHLFPHADVCLSSLLARSCGMPASLSNVKNFLKRNTWLAQSWESRPLEPPVLHRSTLALPIWNFHES